MLWVTPGAKKTWVDMVNHGSNLGNHKFENASKRY